jgi:hypothetical protein
LTVSIAGRLLPTLLGAALLAALPVAPARAVGPDGQSDGQSALEPYEYPHGPEEPEPYPRGWVRAPAVAADLLFVRPAMVVGLAGGAALFVATLPFTAATLTTDDAAHALFDQTLSALARPLGEF